MKINAKEVARATAILGKYKSAKAALERRIVADEEWWKMRASGADSTGWLFNAVANRHADAMDNVPSPFVLPRERGDEESAKGLSEILPALLDASDFESVWSDVWYDKLKHGTGCYGVFWDPVKLGGKGDVEIKRIDLLNLFWQSGISDLQDSENVFYTRLVGNEELQDAYPFVDLSQTPEFSGAKYLSEGAEDTEGKSVVVDWYYKKLVGGRKVLHLCKFCCGQVLYSSEDDKRYPYGIYAHGKYPFFFDRLFVMRGTPCGFGIVDAMKGCQAQIDSLSSSLVRSAELAGRVRYFIRTDGSVNEEEFSDFTKPFVHVHGSRLGEDSLRPLDAPNVDPTVFAVLNHKINELKETAGNRDFNQGETRGGVTAASAITALQEAGNKHSRDMISASYAAFREVVKTVIALVGQFYTFPRAFRILGEDGSYSFLSYSARGIAPRPIEAMGYAFGEYTPEFDVKVSAERRSPFARVTQNEMAKEFFAMGIFDPARRAEAVACVSMMEFEGKDKVIARLTAGEGEADDGISFPPAPKTPLTDAVVRAESGAKL